MKLKTLSLKGNRIERVEHLKTCRLLVSLDLSRNQLTGAVAEVRNPVGSTVDARSMSCLLCADLPLLLVPCVMRYQGLDNLTSLETLNLSDNRLSAIGSLAHLTKLEDLNVGNNQLTTLDGQFPPNLVVRSADLDSVTTNSYCASHRTPVFSSASFMSRRSAYMATGSQTSRPSRRRCRP